jgi:hypothetical protein
VAIAIDKKRHTVIVETDRKQKEKEGYSQQSQCGSISAKENSFSIDNGSIKISTRTSTFGCTNTEVREKSFQ